MFVTEVNKPFAYDFSSFLSSVFRLIVIAEKDVVYNEYPIPLINRLEKHLLVTSTSLTSTQKEAVKKVKNWVNAFAKVTRRSR